MKKSAFLLSLIYCLLLSACATIQDLGMAKQEFAEKTDVLKSREENLDNKVRSLESQTESLSATTKTLTEGMAAIRQTEADKGVDIGEIKEKLEALTGRIDELQKGTTEIKSGMDRLNATISAMEKSLDDINRKPEAAAPDADHPSSTDMKGKTESDIAYDTALNSFKEENFGRARTEFEAYLTRYPNGEKAASATYWIGECLYFEDKFEQAILQYDKVVKDYPTADKIPNALLKEGLSFDKLGDKTTAKILFQQIAQSYPNTNEAAVAEEKLQEMEESDKSATTKDRTISE